MVNQNIKNGSKVAKDRSLTKSKNLRNFFTVSYLSRSSRAGLVQSSDTVSYACLLDVEIRRAAWSAGVAMPMSRLHLILVSNTFGMAPRTMAAYYYAPSCRSFWRRFGLGHCGHDGTLTDCCGAKAQTSAAVREVLGIDRRCVAPQDQCHRCVRSRRDPCASHPTLCLAHESGRLPDPAAGYARSRGDSSRL